MDIAAFATIEVFALQEDQTGTPSAEDAFLAAFADTRIVADEAATSGKGLVPTQPTLVADNSQRVPVAVNLPDAANAQATPPLPPGPDIPADFPTMDRQVLLPAPDAEAAIQPASDPAMPMETKAQVASDRPEKTTIADPTPSGEISSPKRLMSPVGASEPALHSTATPPEITSEKSIKPVNPRDSDLPVSTQNPGLPTPRIAPETAGRATTDPTNRDGFSKAGGPVARPVSAGAHSQSPDFPTPENHAPTTRRTQADPPSAPIPKQGQTATLVKAEMTDPGIQAPSAPQPSAKGEAIPATPPSGPIARANNPTLPSATQPALLPAAAPTLEPRPRNARSDSARPQPQPAAAPFAPDAVRPEAKPVPKAQEITAQAPSATIESSAFLPGTHDAKAPAEQLPLAFLTREAPGVPTAFRADLAPQAATELPRAVVPQIIDALRVAPGVVDLTLSPEELGRVTLTLTTEDAGVIVNAIAERPETMDLLRRSIALLEQEARLAGYESVGFAFGEERRSSEREALPDTDGSSGPSNDMPDSGIPEAASLPGSSRLDLRL